MSVLSSVALANPFSQLLPLSQMGANLKCIAPIGVALFAKAHVPQVAAFSRDGSCTPPVVVPMLLYSCMAACYLKIDNALAQVACCACLYIYSKCRGKII